MKNSIKSLSVFSMLLFLPLSLQQAQAAVCGGENFDPSAYLARYPELKQAGISTSGACRHYQMVGKKQGKVGTPLNTTNSGSAQGGSNHSGSANGGTSSGGATTGVTNPGSSTGSSAGSSTSSGGASAGGSTTSGPTTGGRANGGASSAGTTTAGGSSTTTGSATGGATTGGATTGLTSGGGATGATTVGSNTGGSTTGAPACTLSILENSQSQRDLAFKIQTNNPGAAPYKVSLIQGGKVVSSWKSVALSSDSTI